MTKYSKEIMADVVKNSFSYSDVARAFDLKPGGGNIEHMRKLILKYELSVDHFTGQAHNRGKTNTRKRTHAQVLKNSGKREEGWRLKIALLEAGKKEECELCYTGPMWNNKKIVLVADHINGNRHDHRISNLRILCPNCHSQTDTFSGKNKK
jgi:hypothetical protein